MISLVLRLRLICISATQRSPTHGIVAVGAARVLTSAVCVIFSLQIVDADAAVIGVLGIVPTGAVSHLVGEGVSVGVEHPFAAGAGAGRLLEIFEALGHALFVNSISMFKAWRFGQRGKICLR